MLLVTHQAAYGIAIDRTHVYWSLIGEGSVYAIAKSGDPKTLRPLFRKRRGPRFLAVDDEALYVTLLEGGEVVRVGKDGDPASLEVLASGQPKPWEIAVDATHVYFGCTGDGALKRVPKGGGAIEVVSAGSDPGGIAVDDGSVYWLDREGVSAGSVRRWSKRDPPDRVVVMATGQARPAGIAIDGGFVYWTNFNGGTVNKLPKHAPAGSRPVELARGQKAPTGVSAADPEWIYFTSFGGRTVARVSRSGGTVTALPSGTTKGPVRIAVDETSLYWTASESSGVFKLAK
jgi:streptogramin lyase